MKTVLETIDEFGELHFPDIFEVVTIDSIRPRKMELGSDGKIRDCCRKRKRKIDDVC